ncbi:transmembrane protein, putative (macronuclear) [Tetrahymena thermophila SB210]|uniref:Transmembrane protein, putative n=1 Tax=Tetrahymena thermophila (strain SB210) TaxID=312017 RepID=I7MA58_TETTS|nr:transmembrane protein, putative [Tetrahymena thermophila SB210]EAS03764.2 transmembrane protein, putative [Tetrahymena thermophila SB210]|eukprot:XP_001024009.2 transmembrane protein, putative [Tetrahymena thermophila SB210]
MHSQINQIKIKQQIKNKTDNLKMRILKKVDLFGSPFAFEMGTGNDKMKTSFGGLLTLIIISVSLLYFGYLNYMFFEGNFQPKISAQQKRLTKNFSLPILPDLLWFDIRNLDTDETLMQKQKLLGQQFISYKAYLQQSDSKGNRVNDIQIPVDFCQNLITNNDQVDPNSQCLDFSSLSKDQAKFQVFAAYGFDTKIYIEVDAVCSGDLNTCLNSDLFDQYVFGDSASFIMTVKEEQFDSDQKKLDIKLVDLSWDLDPSLIQTSKVILQSTQTTVQSGFILQQQTKYLHFSDVNNNNNSYKTRDSTSTIKKSIIARFFISLSSTQYIQNIQYAQYPEILAQFASILNVLLLFGVLGAIIAKTDIYQYFIDFKLKEYYKLTAFKILRQQNEGIDKGDITSKENNIQDFKLTKDNIVKSLKELDEKDFNKELTKKFKVSFLERAFRSFIGVEKEDYMKKKRSNRDLYEALFFQASQSQDVFELQAEIMRIKKTLALILTPQQYAAIKCCGTSLNDQIPFLLQKSDNDDNNSNKVVPQTDKNSLIELGEIGSQVQLVNEKNFTHIELIDKIDYDEQYFQRQLDSFLQESEKGFINYDESSKRMNTRLLDCLYKTYGYYNKSSQSIDLQC